MEESGANDHFFDALDDFLLCDCSDALEPEPSVSQSTISHLESDISQPSSSLRRLSSAHHHRKVSGTDDKATSSTTNVTQIHDGKTMARERNHRIRRSFEDRENESENIESSRIRENSVHNIEDASVASSFGKNTQGGDSDSSNPLVFLAELVIKAIGFQVKLFISVFTFPAQLLYHFCVFAIDPLQGMKHGREFLLGRVLRLWNVVYESVNHPFIDEWLKEHSSMWKWVTRFGWSFLLSVYVGSILCVFLVAAFVASGFMVRYLVEEPIWVEEPLNFDYTKNSPVAFVPIKSCPSFDCIHCNENIELGKNGGLHVIPPDHKLQATVKLTLPESAYNRNLGVFQVCLRFFIDK